MVRSVHILIAAQVGYADGLNVKCQGRRRVKGDCKHLDLSK